MTFAVVVGPDADLNLEPMPHRMNKLSYTSDDNLLFRAHNYQHDQQRSRCGQCDYPGDSAELLCIGLNLDTVSPLLIRNFNTLRVA